MNRRTSKLFDHVANLLGDTGVRPKGSPLQVFNPAKNLKRKLKARWNATGRSARHTERLGLIRAVIAAHEGSTHAR